MKLPVPQDAFLLGILLDLDRTPDAWQKFMEVYLEHFNLRSCHLMVVSSRSQAMRFHVEAGTPITPEYMELYLEKYIQKDQIINKINTSPTGVFYATNEIADEVNLYESDYFLNFAQPQGMAEGAAACAFTQGEWRCLIGTNRTAEQGKYSPETLERMSRLLPYIEKAIKSTFLIAEHNKNDMRAKAIVNTFRMPVAALTEYGEIWAMNSQMEELIRKENPLYIQDNSLHSSDRNQEIQLSNGPIQILKRADGMDLDLESAKSFKLNSHTRISFQELKEQHEGQTILLGVLVYAVSSNLENSVSIQQLMDIFSLTPAEALVCKRLTEGSVLKEIAQEENKSVYTVREQLQKAFEKTGCSSQVSLMNLLATIPLMPEV